MRQPTHLLFMFKLQPAIFPLSQHVIRFHELPADTLQCCEIVLCTHNVTMLLTIGQLALSIYIVLCNTDFMSQILYIDILVDWSLSGIMTSKLVIRESDFTNDEFLGHYPIPNCVLKCLKM